MNYRQEKDDISNDKDIFDRSFSSLQDFYAPWCHSTDIFMSVSTEEECLIIEPELGSAPPAAKCQSTSQSAEEMANSLLHSSRVSENSAVTVATQQLVAMETEKDVTVAAKGGKQVKSEQEGDMKEGEEIHRDQVLDDSLVLQRDTVEEEYPDRSNPVSQENHLNLLEDVHHQPIKDEDEEEHMEALTQQSTPADDKDDNEKDKGDHNKVKHILPISNVPSAIHTITSTAAAQGTPTEGRDHAASPHEDYKSHSMSPQGNNTNRTSPLDKYDSHKRTPLQNYMTSPLLSYSPHGASPPQDYFPNIKFENYNIHKTLPFASPDIIEVHSDRSEEKDFDDVDGDDEHDDSLSQHSTVTDESEMIDITRGNLGLLEQAIALKAEQVKPAGPRELLCAPDIHHQRYITVDDRPKHLDIIRKTYFSKGRSKRRDYEGTVQHKGQTMCQEH